MLFPLVVAAISFAFHLSLFIAFQYSSVILARGHPSVRLVSLYFHREHQRKMGLISALSISSWVS